MKDKGKYLAYSECSVSIVSDHSSNSSRVVVTLTLSSVYFAFSSIRFLEAQESGKVQNRTVFNLSSRWM